MFKSFKIMFTMSLLTGTMIVICSNSWMSMWMGLEINLLSIIPLLSEKSNHSSAESSIKYFITQAMASNIFLISIILLNTHNSQMSGSINHIELMLNSALLIKMGAAPFHAWFPEVVSGLSYMNALIMMTWQKIAPMVALMSFLKKSLFITSVIIVSSLIGSILGINQVELKKIMAYSSINHIAWMIAAMLGSKSIWLFYFLVYSTITANIILVLYLTNISSIKQITSILSHKYNQIIFSMNFLSLGGLPPFLGFFPKWLTIQYLISVNNYLLMIILVLSTLIALFFYLRMSLSALSLATTKYKEHSNASYIVFMTNSWSLMGLMLISLTFNL